MQFIKPEVQNGSKATKELLEINVEDVNNQLPAKSIDFRSSAMEKARQDFQFLNCFHLIS